MKFPRAMYSLRMSFWVVPRSCSDGHALLLADQLVEQQQHRGRRVDRHRRRDLVERDLVERGPHVVDRVDRDPGPADLAEAARIVGVEAELGRQIEGHPQPGRAMLEQIAVALVGLLGARVAGVLAHRPQLLAVHVGVDAARVRILARFAESLGQVRRGVSLGVEPLISIPESVKWRGSSGPTIGAIVRCSSAVAMPSRLPVPGRIPRGEDRVRRQRLVDPSLPLSRVAQRHLVKRDAIDHARAGNLQAARRRPRRRGGADAAPRSAWCPATAAKSGSGDPGVELFYAGDRRRRRTVGRLTASEITWMNANTLARHHSRAPD